MNPKFIVDTSVFNKLFLLEEGREQALRLFEKSALGEMDLYAPSLLFFEVISTAQYYQLNLHDILKLYETQTQYNLKIIEPNTMHRRQALQIASLGHRKSGFPSIYDAIFHAIAMIEEAMMITADRRYFRKVEKLGHILLLEDFAA